MYVSLHFDMNIKVDDLNDIDELGKAIAINILGELFNGEDVLDIIYKGYDEL